MELDTTADVAAWSVLAQETVSSLSILDCNADFQFLSAVGAQ